MAAVSAVTVTRDLPAARQVVWDLIMDPHRLQDWVTIHRRLERADDGAPREGFTLSQRMAIRGAPFNVTWKMVEVDPPWRARWEGAGPARSTARIVYELEAKEDELTTFTYTNEFSAPGGLMGRVASGVLVGGVPEAEANKSLDRLAAVLAG